MIEKDNNLFGKKVNFTYCDRLKRCRNLGNRWWERVRQCDTYYANAKKRIAESDQTRWMDDLIKREDAKLEGILIGFAYLSDGYGRRGAYYDGEDCDEYNATKRYFVARIAYAHNRKPVYVHLEDVTLLESENENA